MTRSLALAVVMSLCASATCQAAERPRPVIGAIRWDAWTRDAQEWLGGEANLGDQRWHYRIPFFGRIVSDTQVEVRGDTQEIMDQEIEHAAPALDYWAFLWYHPESEPGRHGMGRALELYLSSERRSEINYALMLSSGGNEYTGGNHLTPKDKVDETVEFIVARMCDPTYQTVLDGRPLLYLMCDDNFAAYHGGVGNARALVDAIRDGTIASGLANPYIVVVSFDMERIDRYMDEFGFDAHSRYGTPPAAYGEERAYSYLTTLGRWTWDAAKEMGRPYVFPLSIGWDRRPRDRPDQEKTSDHILEPTEDELVEHVTAALGWMGENRELCEANAVLVYAWNEFDEGGWLCPSLLEGVDKLGALRRAITTD